MAAYERVTLNRGGRNSRFDCIFNCFISNLKNIITSESVFSFVSEMYYCRFSVVNS